MVDLLCWSVVRRVSAVLCLELRENTRTKGHRTSYTSIEHIVLFVSAESYNDVIYKRYPFHRIKRHQKKDNTLMDYLSS
jgi:hypothetical protein